MKDVIKYTDQEIEEISIKDPQTAISIRSVYSGMKGDLETELSRLSITLSDFTERTAALMAMSGLLTFLPSLINLQTGYLRYFLVWTFPFLFLAIISFYFSSVRVNSFATQMPTAPSGSTLEIIILKHRVIALQDIWRLNLENYNRVLEWYRGSSALLYMFVVSFSINLYFFTFVGKPEVCASSLVTFSVILIGIAIFYRGKMQSKKGVQYGPAEYNIGIGGPSDPSI